LGGALLARGLGPERPLMVIANNGLDHLLIALAAQFVGVPYAPVTPAYAVMGDDRSKLRHVVDLLRPGLIFVDSADRVGAAAAILRDSGAEIISGRASKQPAGVGTLSAMLDQGDRELARGASTAVGPQTLAKILFTSGSTGMPKGVKHTHGMMTANVEML